MKQLLLSFACFFMMSLLHAQDQVIGKWQTEDKEAIVEVFKRGQAYYGAIIGLKDGKLLTDKENPDKTKRNRPLIGLVILDGLSYKNDKWQGGKIYDPSDGKSYNCVAWLEDNKLKVRGYWGMFYQTETWTRP